ncbi:glycoside hydrolase family 3 C-terminal domain-containing protein [Nonomuraea sp. NPDC005650]|uniref:glycoside hydrolase family 3 C-terminal domain-containing protein n=1 Tax=Nonomuraea sp. NPDC005650 TaxID=3157045 RepID=UPI0033BA74BB
MPFPSQIPCGPQDPPRLAVREDKVVEFDIDDVDGRLFMLDRDLGGSAVVFFSKRIDRSVSGTVVLDGEPVPHLVKELELSGVVSSVLAVRVFGRLTAHGRVHALHVEGFTDTDGIMMEPIDLIVRTRPRAAARQEFAGHEEIARRVAEEGIVLLENRGGVLPLAPGTLNVFGHALHSYRTSLVGAGKINPRHTIGLRSAIGDSDVFTLNEELAAFYQAGGDAVPGPGVLARARAASEVGIVVLTRASGENMDNSSDPGEFYLTDDEDVLIGAVSGAFARTVVVLNTPYPIDTSFVARHAVDALVLAGIGGMLAGPALLRVLDGTVNPSGRLPDTWAKAYADIPASRNFYDCAGGKPRYPADVDVWIDTVYEEGLYVGYRYFSTFGVEPAYPFGYGLSYTTFDLVPEPFTALDPGREAFQIAVTVTNTGEVAGRQVVQAYVSKPDGALEQPALELADFAKTGDLAAGACETVVLSIRPGALATYDPPMSAFVAQPGEYLVHVGSSVADTVVAGHFTLDSPVPVRQAAPRMLPVEPIGTLSRHDPEGTFPTGARSGVKEGVHAFEPARDPAPHTAAVMTPEAERLTFSAVLDDVTRAAEFVAGLSIAECARLLVCAQHGWGHGGHRRRRRPRPPGRARSPALPGRRRQLRGERQRRERRHADDRGARLDLRPRPRRAGRPGHR